MQTPTDTGIAMLVSDIFGVDRRPPLTKPNRPALVIASSVSPLFDVQKEMAAMIPGSKLVIMEGAGHAVFIDEPEKFDQALEAFLRSASPQYAHQFRCHPSFRMGAGKAPTLGVLTQESEIFGTIGTTEGEKDCLSGS